MFERWKNKDGSETIVITENPVSRSLARRLFGFIGKTIFLLLISALPLYLIVKGVNGLLNQEIQIWRRYRGNYSLYGNKALIAAWLHLAFGVGSIGYVFRNEVKRMVKWSIWLAAIVCLAAGLYRLILGS